MKTRALLSLLSAVAISLLISSCVNRTEARREGCKIKVGIVFDIGGKNDRSFNAAAWEGVKRARQDMDICLYDVEPGNPNSIEPAMRAFAEKNFDLIFGVGFAQGPIMQKVAMDYPNIKFAIVDGVIFEADGKTPKENVASLIFREHEGSYLVGMIAAAKSKTGVLGFVGGMDIPLIHKFETGYEEGARAVNPNVRVIDNYVGVTDGAWNNPGKGKELALAQIEKGADVIFTAAGNSGLGAFDAVEQYGRDAKTGEANKFVIGVDSNQNMVKPGFVLTSMVKRVDNACYDVVREVLEGRFQGGFHVFGLEKDGVAYAMDEHNKGIIPEEVLKRVEEAKARIVAGEIKVTDAMANSAADSMVPRVRYLTFLVVAIVSLVGCKPVCIEEVDSTVQDGWKGAFEIKIDRVPESCALFGAIAGANYVISSRTEGTVAWQEVVKVHHDDPLEVSRESIGIVNESVGFAFWVDTFAVTTNAGQSFSIWKANKDLVDFKLPGEEYSNWATIISAKVYKDGSGQILLRRSKNDTGAVTRLLTTDFGQNWMAVN